MQVGQRIMRKMMRKMFSFDEIKNLKVQQNISNRKSIIFYGLDGVILCALMKREIITNINGRKRDIKFFFFHFRVFVLLIDTFDGQISFQEMG
jgi:hypothetical protein